MSRLLLIPLDDTVVFPTMELTLPVDTGDDERVLLVPRHDGEYASVGTVARVVETVRLPGGIRGAQLEGVARGVAGAAETGADGRLRVEVTERVDDVPRDSRTRELEREYRAVVEEILELREADERIGAFLRSIVEPGALADTSGFSPDLTFEQKVELLETLDVADRLETALGFQRERLAQLQVRKRIRDDVESGAAKQQRDYFLRKQMDSIRRELGEDDASVVDEYRTKIEQAGMPDAVREQAERELSRLERIGENGSAEGQTIRTYLDWLVSIPWSKHSEERNDPGHTREVLDADHAGLDDVKDRIVEYVAVRKLRERRGDVARRSPVADDGDDVSRSGDRERSPSRDVTPGTILTLIGPPGTGKTSVGESIARAMGREFVRMSLGGIRDEAEIRGHRRTYIGALPGRLVRALRDAGTMNPVILLDEIDKVGADWRGDPSAALLEVLDPAQNSTFRDHYLDVEIDLSQVVFIATANQADTIPGPLLDRMEVISFDGYTVDEKIAIARDYLWPRQRERNGLRPDEVTIADDVLQLIVVEYTREAGVRQLERELGKVLRKIATRVASSGDDATENGDAVASPENGVSSSGDAVASPETGVSSSGDAVASPGTGVSSSGDAVASPGTGVSSSGDAVASPAYDVTLGEVRDALGRQKVFQEAAARTAVPGVATGLAVTGTGGDVLFIEANRVRARNGSNALTLTGQLGDVMKESARIALTYVRAHADELGIDETAFEDSEFHVHVPAGAIPKDGPSAGITMTTALASLLTGRAVRHTVGMTGEVTLQGRVLPIGGLKQKVLAAHAAGLTDVVLPERNRGDLDDVPADVREAMSFHPVMTLAEVLDLALEPAPTQALKS